MAFTSCTVTGFVLYEDGTPAAGTVKFQLDRTITNGESTRSAEYSFTLDSDGGISRNVNEVQTLTMTGTPTGGTYTLTYSGQTTTAIAYNANAAAIQAALVALSNIAPGDVVVTGTGPFTVTFGGTLGATNVAQLTASSASLTGGTSPTMTPTTATGGSTAATVYALNDSGTYPDLSAGYKIVVTVGDYTRTLRRYARAGSAVELGIISVPTPDAKTAAANVVIKAGALTTTDLPFQAMFGLDITNHRLYVNETGSAVKYVALT